jgi:ethanolamine ammonia-lyase small subunit
MTDNIHGIAPSAQAHPVVANPWTALRRFTDARIALGRAGVSLPTQAHLQFQQAHAEARDAVHQALDVAQLTQDMSAAWLHGAPAPLALHSGAANRAQYLQRPDWGRLLHADSRARLQTLREADHSGLPRPFDLVLVVADGLSALAVQQNAPPFLEALRHKLAVTHWRIAPLCIVEQGRVAVGDAVGEALGARAVVVLIGERPGLSSPDSMGLYLTWMPRVGLTDAARNCISNVRPAGLSYEAAAAKLAYLLEQARSRQLSGVDLKDDTAPTAIVGGQVQNNFLLD